jgi:hypothetical protein
LMFENQIMIILYNHYKPRNTIFEE